MGSFLEDLWSSVFTPGPTPALLVAANVTFAALQTVLFALLLATYSIHFVVLSVLSAALWASINWFAGELKQAQAEAGEEEARRKKEDKKGHADGKPRRKTSGGGALDSSASDTETEDASEEKDKKNEAPSGSAAAAASAFLQPPEMQDASRKRHSVSGESSGYGSTDSEWEKVDEGHVS